MWYLAVETYSKLRGSHYHTLSYFVILLSPIPAPKFVFRHTLSHVKSHKPVPKFVLQSSSQLNVGLLRTYFASTDNIYIRAHKIT